MSTANTQNSFSSNIERLKEIVERLEAGDIDLETGVSLYREACQCVKVCRQKLDEAQNVLQAEADGGKVSGLTGEVLDLSGRGVLDDVPF